MILFVGDTPSKFNTDPDVAFVGAKCHKRLTEWLMQLADSKIYIVINRVDSHFSVLCQHFKDTKQPIVALGNNASKALKDIKHFKLPHPSGRNRQINNKEFIDQKLKECKTFIEESYHD